MERTTLWDGSAILSAGAPDEAIAAAVELNLVARVRFFAAEPGVRLIDNGESLRFIADRAYRVMRARFDTAQADRRIAALLAEARRWPRYITWVVGPVSRPADLVARLQTRGMTVDMQEPGMAASLDHLTPPRPPRLDGALALYRIDPADNAELNTFTNVASASFKRPISMGEQFRRLVKALGPGHPHLDAMRLYLARLPSGEAVGTACAFVGGGVVGTYTVGTVPAYQRQGIASALTYHALMETRAEGLEIAVLHASEEGRNVYLRLGFAPMCYVTWLSTY